MTTFLIAAAVLAVAALLLVLKPMLFGAPPAAGRDATDTQVFRDQLAEIDRDLERGVISPAEAEGARAEVSRRLIRAAERARGDAGATPAPRGVTGMVAGIALLATPLLGAGLYYGTGAPGQPDQPLAERDGQGGMLAARPGQAEAEQMFGEPQVLPEGVPQDYLDLVAQLEEAVEAQPGEAEGVRLLTNAYMRLERYRDAWPLFARQIELAGAAASAELYAGQAEAMILAAGGYVSPEAEDLLAAALNRDPSLPLARYYAGLSLAQAGRVAEAEHLWQRLLDEAPADAGWAPFVREMLAELRSTPAAGGPGPSEEEMAAAQSMSPDERAAMVEGMIARLEERLTTEGGSAEEWYRLIMSYQRLNRPDEAARAYGLAMRALPEGLDKDQLRAAVSETGLAGNAGPAPGPSQDDIAAAQSMSAEERRQMIEGMVARLEDRLTAEGGEPEEWLRLISSYMTLDQPENARRAYGLSQESLKGSAASFIREQALVMGVIAE